MSQDLYPPDILRIAIGFATNPNSEADGALFLNDPVKGLLDTGKLGGTEYHVSVLEDLRRLTIKRGAARADFPLIRYEAGSGDLALLNLERQYDPTNLDGPYVAAGATQVEPMRPVLVSATLPQTATRNIATNPSFEVSTTSWAAQGNAELTAVADVVPWSGIRSLEIRRRGSSGVFPIYGAMTTGVEASTASGDVVTVSAYLWFPATSRSKITGLVIGGTGFPGNAFVDIPGGAEEWVRVSRTDTLTGALTDIQIQCWTDDSHADGDVVAYLDAVQAEVAPAPSPYCDGSIPGCSWTGTEHASASVRPDAADFPLMTGFVDSWELDWQGPNWSEASAAFSDAFHLLEEDKRAAVSPVGAGELSGARVNRILDSVGWPADRRAVDTGTVTLQATTLEGPALAELQAVAEAELGALYIRGDGVLVFRDRNAAMTDPRSTTAQAVFGDAGGAELPYKDGGLGLAYDTETLINRIIANRDGGSDVVLEDLASQEKYRVHAPISGDDLPLEDDTAVEQWAGFLLQVSSRPELRFTSMEIWPRVDPDRLWPQVLGRDIGDRITVIRRPPGGGDPIVRDVFIRGIEHVVTPDNWVTRWTFQSASAFTFFTLNVSRLDQERLGF